jgi:ribulose-5-phosphate 4-epimerase/fuculose-1-phosphate aldolase
MPATSTETSVWSMRFPHHQTDYPSESWRDVRAEEIALVDPSGHLLAESFTEPTVELPMHLSFYRARSDVSAIVHSHAEDSQVFAAAERDIPTCTIDAYTRLGFGPVRCGAFGVVASEELGLRTVAALGETAKAALMARHGAVAVGVDLADALFTATVLEKAARQALRLLVAGIQPPRLTLSDIFGEATARGIQDGTIVLDTQTVTVQRLT